MGQYYLIVNVSKGEFIQPHAFGQGAKLVQIAGGGPPGVLSALAALLASGNGRGGGDLGEHPITGSWAGDRIVVAGDYAHDGLYVAEFMAAVGHADEDVAGETLYFVADKWGKDISQAVKPAIYGPDPSRYPLDFSTGLHMLFSGGN